MKPHDDGVNPIRENPLAVKASQERERVNDLNRAALNELMRVHRFTLPRNALDWRPTKKEKGTLRGLIESVVVLATDGVVAYFLTPEGRLLYGHNANFDGDIKPLHSVPKESAPKERSEASTSRAKKHKTSKTSSALAEAIALLQSL